jgi:hypothetical protein
VANLNAAEQQADWWPEHGFVLFCFDSETSRRQDGAT